MKEEAEELEFKKTKYPHLKLAAGFKDGDGEIPQNWLMNMEIGTVFLACPKTPNPQGPLEYLAEEYTLIDKTGRCALLAFDDHRGQGKFMVSAERFVTKMILEEVLGIVDVSGSRSV
jgi:hypothetical protein